jgi:hypothetical protein
MSKGKKQLSMNDHLTRFLELIDSQIAREMQRTPAERSLHGVQKWQPIATRVERVASHVIEEFSAGNVKLDSLIVAMESFARILRILVEELGEGGIGKVRAGYCRESFKNIDRDIILALEALGGKRELN